MFLLSELKMETIDRLKALPKIELHAHLNGSVRLSHLADLDLTGVTLPNPIRHSDSATPTQYFDFMGAVSRITSASVDNLKTVLRRILDDFQSDNVVYLELRSSPKHSSAMTKTQYIESILDCIRVFSLDSKMTVRYLVSIDQSTSFTEMSENADLGIKYAALSQYVVGVDLCGNYLKADKEKTLSVLQKCKDAGLKIAYHIAEDPVTSELDSEVLQRIKPDRLGHAVFIDPTSKEGQFIRDHCIPIECCMTSNLCIKSVSSYNTHHFKTWRDLSHPVTLCTDDQGTFNTSLSEEYFHASKAFRMTKDDFMKMNFDACAWIFDEDIKIRLQSIFQ